MTEDDFEELAGRIEGLARFTLMLAAELEVTGVIDGPAFTDKIRRPRPGPPHLAAAAQTLDELAVALNGARRTRQERGGQG